MSTGCVSIPNVNEELKKIPYLEGVVVNKQFTPEINTGWNFQDEIYTVEIDLNNHTTIVLDNANIYTHAKVGDIIYYKRYYDSWHGEIEVILNENQELIYCTPSP